MCFSLLITLIQPQNMVLAFLDWWGWFLDLQKVFSKPHFLFPLTSGSENSFSVKIFEVLSFPSDVSGLKRCGKSCRLRWLNYLRPDIKHGGFTEDEDNIIVTLYNNIGSRLVFPFLLLLLFFYCQFQNLFIVLFLYDHNHWFINYIICFRWSVIASHLPRRTDNDVKNYWNTKLKKKLSGKADLKKGSNNNGNATSNSIIHLSSVQFPGSIPKVEDYDYGISVGFGTDSSPVSYQTGMSYQQDFHSQGLVSNPAVQFPLPGPMEVSEFNTSGNTSYSISSSQEVSSLSAASSSLALDNTTHASWSSYNGGRVQDDEFLFDFGSPYGLLSGFGFQEQAHEAGLVNQI